KEFARVPFAEASIANIVRESGISRGSFYQYFEDKEDVFFYLLNEQAQKTHLRFIDDLKYCKGNIFHTFMHSFEFIIHDLENEENHNFLRNVFLHLNYETEKTLVNNISNYGFNERYQEMRPLIDTSQLHVENDEELLQVLQMTITIMMHNFVKKFAKDLSKEEVLQNFKLQLKLLQRGFVRE